MKRCISALLLMCFCFVSNAFPQVQKPDIANAHVSAAAASATPETPVVTAAVDAAAHPVPPKGIITTTPNNETYGAFALVVATLVMTVFIISGFNYISSSISSSENPRWSLTQALSEESSVQPTPAPPTPLMVASSSRLIAFLGAWVIVALIIGLAYYILWALFFKADLTPLDKVTSFMSSAWIMFAPYAVNKVGTVLSSVGKATN